MKVATSISGWKLQHLLIKVPTSMSGWKLQHQQLQLKVSTISRWEGQPASPVECSNQYSKMKVWTSITRWKFQAPFPGESSKQHLQMNVPTSISWWKFLPPLQMKVQSASPGERLSSISRWMGQPSSPEKCSNQHLQVNFPTSLSKWKFQPASPNESSN